MNAFGRFNSVVLPWASQRALMRFSSAGSKLNKLIIYDFPKGDIKVEPSGNFRRGLVPIPG